jgi:hypothetical protein
MYSNPNGENLEMVFPVHTGLGGSNKIFGNHPVKDRPANL